ncbi:hypothetical protein [Domibacillus robiginosus]|uniref:hypothetical protein n=1 Tax=Domibacillus robiginosus TaxID=1071054 RepID=UPI00067A920B|nr:hypothetical protein [Domibacillus robiginosus]
MIDYFTENLTDIFPLIFIGLAGWLLWKKGKLKVVTKIAYVYKQGLNHLRVSFKRFNGFDEYSFWLKKGASMTLVYEVTVEQGELQLEWRNRKKQVWKHVFTADESGTVSFTAERHLYVLQLDGKRAKGGCRIELINQKAKKGGVS